ncbi:uncharacterized protein LOC108930000 [Scleropages formosus]|uniref:uncharacterized protein LOC108930000 n=1 Tax=Scleropages formosus TaxID=113540 RepID=UPI00087815FF|nr:uncharacterized protein LOC108930000 [Scleropages formosus]
MGIHSTDATIRTLNEVADLSDVSFGHGYPRHGLRLLHWLANSWITFRDGKDGKMRAACDPAAGAFGFRPFHNVEKILPPLNNQSKYFEVGNLYVEGAERLPFGPARGGGDASNTDRIIVRMEPGLVVAKVYVTEHVPQHNSFCVESTRCVSRQLIHCARSLSESSFLQQADYRRDAVVHEQAFRGNGKASARKRVCNCVIL